MNKTITLAILFLAAAITPSYTSDIVVKTICISIEFGIVLKFFFEKESEPKGGVIIWEKMESSNYNSVYRAMVYGGWLVLIEYDVQTEVHHLNDRITSETGHELRGTVTFVPDSNHAWNYKSPIKSKL